MPKLAEVKLQREDERLTAWRLFLESYRRVLDTLDDELQSARGLSLTRYDVLVQLFSAPDQRLRMNQLASRILLSKSGLTRLIDRMEAEGLVERASSPNDRRGSFAVLTPRGEQVFREAGPIHLDGIHKHFASHLTAAEARTLAKAFEKIRGPLISAADCAPTD
ncbi:MAG TPA: MarR family transcriptional regulator [Actinomycetota bacterium]|nr:MarR family transcriptional regulator [Actinomycetota bacterium]